MVSGYMKIVLYTALFSNYDKVEHESAIYKGYDRVIFTDQNIQESDYLKVVKIPKGVFRDPVIANRFFKFHPHFFFKEYDFAVYHDANLDVVGSINEFVKMLATIHEPVSIYAHPCRNTVSEELDALLYYGQIGVGTYIKVRNMINMDTGFYNRLTLTENNIIISKPNDIHMQRLFELCFNKFVNVVRRDQIALSLALRDRKVAINIMPAANVRCLNPLFKYRPHKSKIAISDFVQSKWNRLCSACGVLRQL